MGLQVWLITGASRGIGAEIVNAVLGAGHRVVATARKLEALDKLPDDERICKAAMDVTDETQVDEAVAMALGQFGRIDVLVNNAGYGLLGAVEEGSAAEIEQLYRTNVFGLLNVTRAVLPILRWRRSGHIINMSSVGGFNAFPGWGLYCSTKFAVEGISEALHDELAPLGIHVTAVEPGYFRTDFLDGNSLLATKRRLADYESTAGKTREDAAERNHEQPGDPKKLAQIVLQIASSPDPPARLPLGSDAVSRLEQRLAQVAAEAAKWRDVSLSTDFAEEAKAQSA